MQRTSQLLLCCCSNSLTLLSPSTQQLTNPHQHRLLRAPSVVQLHFAGSLRLHNYRHALLPLQTTATQEIIETSKSEVGFTEVGYLAKVHGLQGEIRVKPKTDFPELRFSKPGRRWLKRLVSGRETVQEVDLVEGRGQPGQRSWILKFKGIDTVDQAKELIGSILLVDEEDRPELDEGEIYTGDLVGMKIIVKETGEPVGTVVKVYNTGASDLLQVRLDSSPHVSSGNGIPDSSDKSTSSALVWVPFVEAIVPDVDIEKREMHITPPKGLLELNIRKDERSKKERRQLEWKERKKFQKRLISAKKKLCELKQEHVFHGFRFGEKAQRSLLSNQIVDVNAKLLHQALQNIDTPSKRWDRSEIISVMNSVSARNVIKISKECVTSGKEEMMGANFKYLEKGLSLISEGKVGVVLVMKSRENEEKDCDVHPLNSELSENLRSSLHKIEGFVKVEDRASIPLVMVCPDHKTDSVELLFSENNYYGFDSEKVLFLEEEKLPVISSSIEDQNKHKIMMKTPWEMLQSRVGSGGVISLLSEDNILDKFGDMGVQYIQVCSIGYNNVGIDSLLPGLVSDHTADVGIQISNHVEESQEDFHMVCSMNFMRKLAKRIDKLQFHAIPKSNSHVVFVEKEWVDVTPSSPNSYELRSSIYSSLNACSLDKVCIVEITK